MNNIRYMGTESDESKISTDDTGEKKAKNRKIIEKKCISKFKSSVEPISECYKKNDSFIKV